MTYTKEDAIRELKEIANETNDDYYPVLDITLTHAIEFVNAVPDSIPVPDPGIDPDGSLNVEWYQCPNQVLSVSIEPNRKLCYAALYNDISVSGVLNFENEIPIELLNIISEIYKEF